MAKTIGANLSLEGMKTSFPHPADSTKEVNCILDPCHVLKLIRNSWSSIRIIHNSKGNKIEWKYIERLVDLQEAQGLHAGNKLRRGHINWREKPMKVNIAAQTLSSSVADAIDFCRNSNIKGFENSEHTAEFIRIVDHWFDILNSRNPCGQGFKAPMKINNQHIWQTTLNNTISYIKGLKCNLNKVYMVEHIKKTGFLGVIVSSISITKVFEVLVLKNEHHKYLLTYKVSQDHIELFLNALRGRGGWCVNPTPRHFSAAYKKLLVHHQIKTSSGNVEALDNTEILFATRTPIQRYSDTLSEPEITPNHDRFTDDTNTKKTSCIEDHECMEDIINNLPSSDERTKIIQAELNDFGLEMPPNYFVLSEYADNAVGFIAGYVVRMVSNLINY